MAVWPKAQAACNARSLRVSFPAEPASATRSVCWFRLIIRCLRRRLEYTEI